MHGCMHNGLNAHPPPPHPLHISFPCKQKILDETCFLLSGTTSSRRVTLN